LLRLATLGDQSAACPENDRVSDELLASRLVRDDPERPDPGFAELYASLPDATDLEPWLTWCRRAAPPVLYLGVGAGRLAVPLVRAGIDVVGVDAHPGMLARLRPRLPHTELLQAVIERLDLDRRFELVLAPSNILYTAASLTAAARHSSRWVAFELLNPHWLAAGAGAGVQVRRMDPRSAEIDIDYAGGWRQRAEVSLVWPEDLEALLDEAGLELHVMRAAGPATDLAASSSFHVLASLPEADRLSSNAP
jgi:Methyltransferase domain